MRANSKRTKSPTVPAEALGRAGNLLPISRANDESMSPKLPLLYEKHDVGPESRRFHKGDDEEQESYRFGGSA